MGELIADVSQASDAPAELLISTSLRKDYRELAEVEIVGVGQVLTRVRHPTPHLVNVRCDQLVPPSLYPREQNG